MNLRPENKLKALFLHMWKSVNHPRKAQAALKQVSEQHQHNLFMFLTKQIRWIGVVGLGRKGVT